MLRLGRIALAALPLVTLACSSGTPAHSTATVTPSAPSAAPGRSPGPPASPSSSLAPSAGDPRLARTFGAPVRPGAAQPFSAVMAAPEDGHAVLVEGKVRANCTRKGCWMELADGMDAASTGCRVTFKDYGFFVPLDAKGSDARVEGVLAVKTLSPDDVRHYESEGGHFPNKLPDGSAREVRIVATGVELRR